MIRQILVTAITLGLFTSSVYASPKKQQPSCGMSKQDELQIMRRVCQMSRDGYTSGEILSQASYLVKINTEQITFPKGQGTGSYADDLMDHFSSLLEERNAITNKQIAFSLMQEATTRNCKF